MKIGLICGSKSDLPILEKATKQLDEFGVSYEVVVASAHRTPKKVEAFVQKAEKECDCIIAAAGLSAALPGAIAALTTMPVIGIPIAAGPLNGKDALYSIAQLPPGVPVACVAINGAKNAAILAAEVLGLKYPEIKEKLKAFREQLAK